MPKEQAEAQTDMFWDGSSRANCEIWLMLPGRSRLPAKVLNRAAVCCNQPPPAVVNIPSRERKRTIFISAAARRHVPEGY
jgi:hypothetical protein